MKRPRPVGAGATAGQRQQPLEASLAEAPGVGPKRLMALRARGIHTFLDALQHLPYRYQDLSRRNLISELQAGVTATVEGTLHDLKSRAMRGMSWRRLTTGVLKDSRGNALRVAWFNLHGDGRMPAGEPLLLHGRVGAATDGVLQMLHPEIIRLNSEAPPALRAMYSLPAEIPQRLFSTIIAQALERSAIASPDAIPSELRSKTGLPALHEALTWLHQPPAGATLEELAAQGTQAHQALALDEMFSFQLALAQERRRCERRTGAALNNSHGFQARFVASLPFALTQAQRRTIAEISTDLARRSPMNRILIGDVGSGKTVVAFHALLQTISAGWQAVMMAPTELLAEQHFQNFTKLFSSFSVTSALLTGKVTGAERERLLRAIKRGDIAILFGTHALFQENVRIDRLGLAVIDEQHRFGVFDRARLIARGVQTNVLLMTATPIPRSLALTLLRNLDVSVLDESPSGRIPVATEIFGEAQIAAVDHMVAAELDAGHRAYYVLPLIEGDDDQAASVAAAAKRLASVLPGGKLGLLHGRMNPAEKDRVMRQFRSGALNVLVATTVVEVGMDVPEATIMVVIAAERYGLAQLHQLRGRVGRSSDASRCCLIVSHDTPSSARERLETFAQTTRGEEIAALDLRTRGPGDLFGNRQSGALPLRFSSLIRDPGLIARAGELADEWLSYDPELKTEASRPAANAIRKMLALGFSLGDVG
jgi:ATP-dependent DNA helicase RecG